MGTRLGRSFRRIIFLLAAASAPLSAAADEACAPDRIDFRSEETSAAFSIEVVDTEETRARGLMHREEMRADHGMLFVYPDAGERAFWMKNTPLPLDIVFLNARGVVCSIAASTTPFSLDIIPSGCAAQTVLEVNAGVAAAVGLGLGAVARHPAIARPLRPCG